MKEVPVRFALFLTLQRLDFMQVVFKAALIRTNLMVLEAAYEDSFNSRALGDLHSLSTFTAILDIPGTSYEVGESIAKGRVRKHIAENVPVLPESLAWRTHALIMN